MNIDFLNNLAKRAKYTFGPTMGCEALLSELATTAFENTDVKFRTDTDLGHINEALVSNLSLQFPVNIDEQEQTSRLVSNINNYLQSEDGNRYFQDIQKYSEQFSSKLNSAFYTLKTKIAPEVEDLTNKILKETSNTLSRATQVGFNEDGEVIKQEPKFTYIDINNFRTESSIDNAKELTSKYLDNQVKSIEVITLRYILNKFPEFKEVDVNLDTLQDYAKLVADDLKENGSSDAKFLLSVLNIITSVFKKSEYDSIKTSIFNDGIYEGKIDEYAIRNAYSFSFMRNVYATLDKYVDLPNQEDLKSYKSNLQLVDDLYKASTVLLYLASEKLANSLVIGANMINKSGLVEFSRQGGTIEDISNYLRCYHNTNKEDIFYNRVAHGALPIYGISVKDVLVGKDMANEKLENEYKKQYQSIISTATKQAFTSVLNNYVNELHLDRDTTALYRDHISNLSDTLVRYKAVNVMDAIYDFFMRAQYNDSLVSNIYYKLGASLVSDITNNEQVSTDTVEYAHFSVMCDILSEYIAKTMIVPTKM